MVSLIAVLLMVAGILQAQNAAKPVRLIAGPIENNQIITLKGNVHPLATAANDRGAAPDSLPLERMVLLLNRSAQQQQALLKLADDQQNSKSHAYHKWLTPAQFGAQFGIGDADLATLSTWLES
jgi:subtilase family serine protease